MDDEAEVAVLQREIARLEAENRELEWRIAALREVLELERHAPLHRALKLS